ncbi:MAG: LamG domain-containing protein, partial [Deltaproteobacteria bacterium]|nr:LamG domain-containing protein [Deltaproteobacteria bacterium]
IASSAVTLNVAIQSSAVTLDVNIASSAVTLDINVTNPVLQVGQTKPCLAFDGVDDWVRVEDAPSLRSPNSLTIIMWIYPLENSAESLIQKGTSLSNYDYYLDLKDGVFRYTFIGTDDSVNPHPFNLPVSVNRWHFIALTRSGSDVVAYVDENSDSWTAPLDAKDSGGWIEIGQRAGGHGYDIWFPGRIASVLIYNRPLTPEEIQHNYENPQSPVTKGLVLWLNFDEGSGTVAHDKSGNGNDGTIYGATWVSEAGEVPALVNVNLSAQTVTMEVKIVASEVTVDVNVVGTVNVNITEAIVNISALKLMDEGALLVKSSWCSEGYTTTLYTVPTGKKAYIYLAHLTVKSTSTTTEGNGTLYVYDGTNEYILIKLYVDPDHPCMSDSMAFTLLKLLEGWEVRLYAEASARCDGSVILVEVPA